MATKKKVLPMKTKPAPELVETSAKTKKAKGKGTAMQRGISIAALGAELEAAAAKKTAKKRAAHFGAEPAKGAGRKSATRKVVTKAAPARLGGRPSTLRGGYAKLAAVLKGSEKLAAAVGVTLRSIQRYSAQVVNVPVPVMMRLRELAKAHGIKRAEF